jgi:hypothetical protein
MDHAWYYQTEIMDIIFCQLQTLEAATNQQKLHSFSKNSSFAFLKNLSKTSKGLSLALPKTTSKQHGEPFLDSILQL